MDGRLATGASKRIFRSLGMLVLVVVVGTAGYMRIEGWRFLDALYMTVITITTVGFGEVAALSETGRTFTVILIFMGMGIMAYAVGMVGQVMIEFQLRSIFGRRKVGLKIKSIKNHYIICGYGRIGRIISQELKAHGIPMLVIEENMELKETLEAEGVPYLIGDATSEEVLQEAGIERAKGLVAVVLSDAENVFITMTARSLKPELFILSRADEEKTQRKLLRAGADRVVMPYLIGGQKMAQTIVKPAVADFLELTVDGKDIGLRIEELPVADESPLVGASLMESGIRQEMNVMIIGIRKAGGEMLFNPSSQSQIEAGDTLIALGHRDDLEKLSAILTG